MSELYLSTVRELHDGHLPILSSREANERRQSKTKRVSIPVRSWELLFPYPNERAARRVVWRPLCGRSRVCRVGSGETNIRTQCISFPHSPPPLSGVRFDSSLAFSASTGETREEPRAEWRERLGWTHCSEIYFATLRYVA